MLLKKLLRLADKLKIDVYFLEELWDDGCYLAEFDLIYIKVGLGERKTIYTLAHELGHAINHKDFSILYASSASFHSKMEFEAELVAIKTVLQHYNSFEDLEIDQVDFMRFMDCYEIDYSFEEVVKEVLYAYYKPKACNF